MVLLSIFLAALRLSVPLSMLSCHRSEVFRPLVSPHASPLCLVKHDDFICLFSATAISKI
jgi:hypothetical protein